MSILTVERHSYSLARRTTLRVILPDRLPAQFTAGNPCFDRPPKTLFLLHGYSENSTEWLCHAPVAAMAVKYNLAVVMPDGDVGFYVDGAATGAAYGAYVGQELPAFLRETFGLPVTAENTLIGGDSMGGFGALRTALRYPETFGGAFGLSSALIIHTVAAMAETHDAGTAMANYDYYVSCFGDPAAVVDSDKNPETLVKRLVAAGGPMPKLYMACGTEDFLLAENRAFRDFLISREVPLRYEEGPGAHDWDFWNRHFEPALKYLLG